MSKTISEVKLGTMFEKFEQVAKDFAESNGFECKIENLYPFKIMDDENDKFSVRFEFELKAKK